jgi:hypothetical protein
MLWSPTPPHYIVIAKDETHDLRRYHLTVYAGSPPIYSNISIVWLSLDHYFQPTIFTRAARSRQTPVATVTPENTITGPNPLAIVSGIIKSREIGISVNAEMELTAEINPSLH